MTCQHHLYPTIITTTARGVPCELGGKNISTITPKNISRPHKNIACLSPPVTDLNAGSPVDVLRVICVPGTM